MPWADTLCRRAFNESRRVTRDVASRWWGSAAARDLGIQTYVSVPVRGSEGEVFGTLCGASDVSHEVPSNTVSVMAMFAQLIAQELARERDAERARSRAKTAERSAALFKSLSEAGEACSRATSLAGGLSESARILGCMSSELQVIWFEAGDDTAGPGPEPGVAAIDRRQLLPWLERLQVTGRLAEGGGWWWQRRDESWQCNVPDGLVTSDIQRLGIACAHHQSRMLGAVVVYTRSASALDDVLKQAMMTVSLHLSLLAGRLDLADSLQASYHELERQSRLDPLTGLPNRRQLDDEAARLALRTWRHGGQACIAFIDLDRFKSINDEYGHEAGDQFLIEVGRRLRELTRADELCVRLGGDEFVLLSWVREPAGTQPLKRRLAEALRGEFDLGSVLIDYAGPSIGVALQQRPEEPLDDLLGRADAAMYAEKKARYGRSDGRP